MGDRLTQHACEVFIQNFIDYEVVTEQEAGLMKAAISDKALASVAPEIRDETRAAILRNMLLSLTI